MRAPRSRRLSFDLMDRRITPTDVVPVASPAAAVSPPTDSSSVADDEPGGLGTNSGWVVAGSPLPTGDGTSMGPPGWVVCNLS